MVAGSVDARRKFTDMLTADAEVQVDQPPPQTTRWRSICIICAWQSDEDINAAAPKSVPITEAVVPNAGGELAPSRRAWRT
jgi:hypothetical protein